MNIEEQAKQAGMNVSMWNYGAGSIVFTMGTEGVARGAIERFAAIIRNEALEEAAKACDELAELNRESPTDSMWQQGECASAIRNLKQGVKE